MAYVHVTVVSGSFFPLLSHYRYHYFFAANFGTNFFFLVDELATSYYYYVVIKSLEIADLENFFFPFDLVDDDDSLCCLNYFILFFFIINQHITYIPFEQKYVNSKLKFL